MQKLLYIFLLTLIASCATVREKTGLVKYQPDEYQVTTNPSLSVPPNFNIYSPEELEAQKKNNVEIKRGKFTKSEESVLEQMNQE